MRLDALLLKDEHSVLSPTADFSRLPYASLTGDNNASVAWLSEEIVPHPFEHATLRLRAGLHLHWTLPDAFLRGTNHGQIRINPKYAEQLDSNTLTEELRRDLSHHEILLSNDITVHSGGELWNVSGTNYRFKLKIQARGMEDGQPVWQLQVQLPGLKPGASFVANQEFVDELNAGTLPQDLGEDLESLGLAGAEKPHIQSEKRWSIEDNEADRIYHVTLKQKRGNHPRQTLRVQSKSIVFPAVPNRWLIERMQNATVTGKAWIVESDYLGMNGELGQPAVWYPVHAQPGGPPCRRLGRQVDYTTWSEKKPSEPNNYVSCLTALGYGDPSFAAFYPSCYSAFGFYDSEIGEKSGQIEYQVIGWHSSAGDDPLQGARFEDARHQLYSHYQLDEDSQTPLVRDAISEEALRTVQGWSSETVSFSELIKGENKTGPRFPQRSILAGSILVDCKAMLSVGEKAEGAKWDCEVAVGHTVTEALSAFAASKVAPNERAVVEDQVEALHLLSRMEDLHVDIGPKFREARQEKEFAAVDGGQRWTIVPPTTSQKPPDASELDALISDDTKDLLRDLNKSEAQVDRLSGELAVLRRQLYSDWCKYMICAYPPEGENEEYPDADEARRFIECHSLPAVTAKREERRKARKKRDRQRDGIEWILERDHKLALKTRPAARFWCPKEPVLLIEASNLLPTTKHDGSGLLKCNTEENVGIPDSHEISKGLLPKIAGLQTKRHREEKQRPMVVEQSWNPIFLDWKIKYLPMEGAEHVDPAHGGYWSEFVTSRFAFGPKCADLEPREGEGNFDKKLATPYQGRSILTPHGGLRLRHTIEEWMCRQLKLDPNKPDDMKTVRKTLMAGDAPDNWSKVICRVYGQLFGEEGSSKGYAGRFMAQALTGFNAAMLMQRQTLQLPIADPLGFKEDRKFASQVARAVAGENLTAPQPNNHFHPILAGGMQIERLRMVDAFGQFRNLNFDPDKLIIAESMALQGAQDTALLRPRIVQPARIKFRWLAADSPDGDVQEANDHRSALCGWVVPDILQHGLLVHADDGTEMGRISSRGEWEGAPGRSSIAHWQIENRHLARLVASLLERGDLEDFFTGLNKHLAGILPADSAEYDGIQLLLGRPLAVVRARLELQVYALPAANQDWTVFQSELGILRTQPCGTVPRRIHSGFDHVNFQFQLGDPEQLNDGLAAFWEETLHADGRCTLDQRPQTSAERKDVTLSVAGGAVTTTMLIDPRAPVHVRSGVLPAKSIALPKGHYADIMSNMSAALKVGPLLCPQDRIALFTPDTTRFAVTWIEHHGGEWIDAPITATPATTAEWSAPNGIREGWIKLTPHQSDSNQGS
jgi:hypothetical protein